MDEIVLGTALLASLAVSMIFGFTASRDFDRILRTQYEQYPEVWEKDGRPGGLFWRPPGVSIYSLYTATAKTEVWVRWMFATPPWAVEHPEIVDLFRHMRYAFAFSTAGTVAFSVLITLVFVAAIQG